MEPRLLHVVCIDVYNALFPAAKGPVISITSNGADNLGPGNVFERLLNIADKPILRSNRPRLTGDLVLIIVHDYQPVRAGSQEGIVIILVRDWHVHIEP